MHKISRPAIVLVVLVGVGILAAVGGMLRKKSIDGPRALRGDAELRCAYDGTPINPLYQVEAYLTDDRILRFCSIANAARWRGSNPDRALYFMVVDESSGRKMDSTLGHFVESDAVTVPQVRNRIHVFLSRDDAEKHAHHFRGNMIPNPLGPSFRVPQEARLASFTVGAPLLPDALPVRLALFRPIFKENRLSVKVVPFTDDVQAAKLLSAGEVDALVCDLPTGIVLGQQCAKTLIVKNMLRANPFRPLFAIVGRPDLGVGDPGQLGGKAVAVPQGVSFSFYYQFLLKRSGVTAIPNIREVPDLAAAWDMLNKGEVAAAVLRTPYTDVARKRKMPLLADDRTLPWMSVLVVRKEVIEKKSVEIKKFIFAMEQAVLALNLKPDQFPQLLNEQGGIPAEACNDFPMPIFEGANAPAQDELEPVSQWLVQAGLLDSHPEYENVVDTRFLPDPKDVGLAFCCR